MKCVCGYVYDPNEFDTGLDEFIELEGHFYDQVLGDMYKLYVCPVCYTVKAVRSYNDVIKSENVKLQSLVYGL